MKIAMFEGYRKHPRRKRRYGSHKRRRSYRGASPKQMAARRKFKAAIQSCKAQKGKAKFKCVSRYFKTHKS
jgi:hypothetical protein